MTGPDVLIAGGGPAGSALATLAARDGLRVLLIERRRFPRDKVCGEFVSAEGCAVLKRLGLLERLLRRGARPIERFRVHDARGRRLQGDLPRLTGRFARFASTGHRALGVSRAVLDHALLELARESGVAVRTPWEVTAPLLERGRVVGAQTRRPGTRGVGETLRAGVVVAADGRRSALLRALHPDRGDPRRSRPGSWFGLKVHLSGERPHSAGDRVELFVFDRGYAGLAPVENGRWNLCLLVTVATLRACDGSPDRVLHDRIRANPAASRALEPLAVAGAWHSVGPLRFGSRRPATHGLLAVGDAAGTIDPFTGEGISNALLSAEVALPWVRRAVAAEPWADGYRQAWARAFAPVTRRARVLGAVLSRPTLAASVAATLAAAPRQVLRWLVRTTRTGLGSSLRCTLTRRTMGQFGSGP